MTRLRQKSYVAGVVGSLCAIGLLAAAKPAGAADPPPRQAPARDDGSRPLPAGPGGPRPAALPTDVVWHAEGMQAALVVGGPGPEAAAAGLATLRAGGNAADAAATALLVLCVIDSPNYCFGGEVPILVHDVRRGGVEVLCGVGAAPALATLERFRDTGMPQGGPAAAAVPGAVDAILTLLERHGTIGFGQAAAPMLAVLDTGAEPWFADLARTVRGMVAAEAGGADRRAGLRRVADNFYRGPVARRIDAWSRAEGGLLRSADLAAHRTRIEEPITARYRGRTIVKCGAWSQGAMLLQSLSVLEGFDLANLRPDSPDYVHLAVEALKLGLADRDAHLGDPLFATVPLAGLLDPAYAAARRRLVDPAKASRELRPGSPAGGPGRAAAAVRLPAPAAIRDTTTAIVADAMGNVVVATPSGWDGVLAGDTGIWLGSRLQSLNVEPGHPNCVAPGKRPRVTLSPTLVLEDGRPVLAVSIAGGDLQDQVALQLIVGCLDFGLAPKDAVVRPRFSTRHHVGSFGQSPPVLGSLVIDEAFPAETIQGLARLGHEVSLTVAPVAHPVLLRIDPATGRKEAAGEPLARKHAAAY